MPQQINNKILFYFFILIIFTTFNNKNIQNLKLFQIKEIKVTGLDETTNVILQKDLEIIKSKNLLFLKKIELENIINSNYFVEQFSVFKKYPSSIIVKIKKTKFLARVNKNGKYYFFCSNGKFIYINTKSDDLPLVFGNFKNQDFFDFKTILDNSNFDYGKIKNLYFFSSRRWDIELRSGIIIKLPSKNLKESIQLTLNILKDDKFNEIKMIDLRQNKQVVING